MMCLNLPSPVEKESVMRPHIEWSLLAQRIGAYSIAVAVLVLIHGCGGGGGGGGSPGASPDPVLVAQINDIKPADPGDTVAVFVQLGSPRLVAAAATDPATREQLQAQFMSDMQRTAVRPVAGAVASPSCDTSSLNARMAAAYKPSSGAAVRMELSSCELGLLPSMSNVTGVHVDIPLDLNVNVADALALEVQRSFGAGGAWPALAGNSADGTDRIVAVLDTGVESQHPALVGKVLQGACFSSNSALSSSLCPNGQNVDTRSSLAGASCGLGTNSSSALVGNRSLAIQLGCAHGTNMAGVAAMDYSATSGVASHGGMARRAKILPVQVFSRQTSGSTVRISSNAGDLLAALEWLTQLADTDAYRGKLVAVNMSLGGGIYSRACDNDYIGSLFKTVFANLRERGVLPVVAAGNDGNRSAVSFPACVSNAVAVAASRLNHAGLASYTNFSEQVKVLAPGGDIDGSGRFAMPALCANAGAFNCWQAGSGTSPATALVSGTVAALRSVAPAANLAAIETALSSDLSSRFPSLAKTLTEPASWLTRPALSANASAYSLLGLGDPALNSPAVLYTIGGVVSGLAPGQSLTLLNNNADALAIKASGNFVFGTRMVTGDPYAVRVALQPNGQECSVTSGSGSVASADVTGVRINCVNSSAQADVVPPNCLRFNGELVCTAELPAPQKGKDSQDSSVDGVTPPKSTEAPPPQKQLLYQVCAFAAPNYQGRAGCFTWDSMQSSIYGYFGSLRSLRVRTISFDPASGQTFVGGDIRSSGLFKITLTPLSSRSEVVLQQSASDISALLPKNASVRLLRIERP